MPDGKTLFLIIWKPFFSVCGGLIGTILINRQDYTAWNLIFLFVNSHSALRMSGCFREVMGTDNEIYLLNPPCSPTEPVCQSRAVCIPKTLKEQTWRNLLHHTDSPFFLIFLHNAYYPIEHVGRNYMHVGTHRVLILGTRSLLSTFGSCHKPRGGITVWKPDCEKNSLEWIGD